MAEEKKNECPIPSGVLLIIGGHENKGQELPNHQDASHKEDILKKFVSLIPKKNPVIEVVTTASGKPEESFDEYRKLFVGLTGVQPGHIFHASRKEVLEKPMMDRVRKADAFFFAGGDQLKLTSFYGGSEFLTELKRRYIYEGLVIAGTSAGAMALSTPMIYAGNEEDQEVSGEIKITTGLEFLKDVCIDTHFVKRGRFVRMAQVIVTNPTCIGMGIEENTAVIVRNGADAEVLGSGTVIIIEGFFVDQSDIDAFTEATPITIKNLKVHILAANNTYHIPQLNPPHR